MKSFVLSTLLLLFAASAARHDDPADLAAAKRLFWGGADAESHREDYITACSNRLLRDVEGNWAVAEDLSSSPAEFEKVMKNLCRYPTRISDVSQYGFTATRRGPEDDLVRVYTLMIGNSFAFATDIEKWIRYYDMDRLQEMTKRSEIGRISGIATIFRPAANILVLQSNYSVPDIYVRCTTNGSK